jgi:rubredoxin
MNLILKAKELDKLGLWEEFTEIRKIKNPTAYLWGTVENDEFELNTKEMTRLRLEVTLDEKHQEDLGVTVTSRCCNTRFSIYVKDIDNFWFCPSCGDKLVVYGE